MLRLRLGFAQWRPPGQRMQTLRPSSPSTLLTHSVALVVWSRCPDVHHTENSMTPSIWGFANFRRPSDVQNVHLESRVSHFFLLPSISISPSLTQQVVRSLCCWFSINSLFPFAIPFSKRKVFYIPRRNAGIPLIFNSYGFGRLPGASMSSLQLPGFVLHLG